MVLVATFGSKLVRSLTIDFDAPVPSDAFAALAREVHVIALAHSPGEIRRMLAQKPALAPISDLAARVLEALIRLSEGASRQEVVLQGASQVLKQPELENRSHMIDLVQLLEDRRILAQILQERSGQNDVVVTIGSQNRIIQMRFLSLVSSSYHLGEASGTIGVVGPTRMPYGRLVSVVDYLAHRLSQG